MEPRLKKLYDLLISKVAPQKFYEGHVPNQNLHFSFGERMNVWCVFHKEINAPSLMIAKDGQFFCHNGGCRAKGGNIVQFTEQLLGYNLPQALEYLYSKYIRPTISPRIVEQYYANLISAPEMLNWLHEQRGISIETVSRFRIGFDNKRLTIPVYNEHGHVINLRRYDYTKTHEVKMLPYQPGYGGLALFPYDQIYEQNLIVCEGEWDALLLIQHGFNAITATGGVGAFRPEWIDLFRGKTVTICYDVNDTLDVGQKCAKFRGRQLAAVTERTSNLVLPLTEVGGDVSDYFVKHSHTGDDFRALMDGAVQILPDPGMHTKVEVKADGTTVYEVPLSEASKDRYFHAPIATKAVVVAKQDSPYRIPRHMKVSCPKAVCAACPFDGRGSQGTLDLCADLHNVPKLVGVSAKVQEECVRSILRVPDNCPAVIQDKGGCNVEGLLVASDLDSVVGDASRVKRTLLRLQEDDQSGLQANQAYKFEGTSTVDSKQYVIHVATKANPVQSAIETFRLTDDIKKSLEVFQTNDIDAKLAQLYLHLSHNVTRIFQRPDLHQAIDLVWHSPLEFIFDSATPRSARLDVLVLGDTRTGKGFVAEGLMKFYQLGAVTSCENASYAGLIGGNETQDGKRYMVWGKIPLYDKRLLVLDEASALTEDSIQRMSRVRSEGKAEVIKIYTEETLARTRLVWLANCRNGKPLSAHNTGVEAILELIGRSEDVARFDYALTVAGNEVPSRFINSRHTGAIESPYTAEACRSLVLWCWSRTAAQVVVEEEAITAILALSRELGARYSSLVPLIQAESVRIKLAKIAAAIAGRTFSCDSSGEKLVVTRACVEAAYRFLNVCYTKPSMGYNLFSNSMLDRERLKSRPELKAKISELGDRSLDFVEGLLEHAVITTVDLMDSTGNTIEWARAMASFLVRERALKKDGLGYVKRPSFIAFLRDLREEYKTTGVPKGATF